MERFDVVVLGGGWGGFTAAIRARRHGLSVALVERNLLGGTCLHRGCIPTKVLLQSAETLELARRMAEFGVRVSEPALDFDTVMQRKDQVVDQLYRGLQQLVKGASVRVFAGQGRLSAPGRVEVDGPESTTLEAPAIIVATGSRTKSLPGLEPDGQQIVDSDQALALGRIPRSIVILGAGAVGVEFASFYRDAGAEVTLVEMLPALLPLEDRDVSDLLGRLFAKRGIHVLTGTGAVLESVRRNADGVELDVAAGDKLQHLAAECLLVAVGREPCSAGIGLEEAGVALERGFVKVDEQLRTSISGVYAAGDVNGGLLLAHVAAAEGAHAADVIAGKTSAGIEQGRMPRATYCRPQVASVGLSEGEANASSRPVKIGRAHLRANGKALIEGETEGLVKVVADAENDDLLGLHLIGPGVTEMVAAGALGRFLDASLWELASCVFPHPTVSEAIGEAAQAAMRASVRR